MACALRQLLHPTHPCISLSQLHPPQASSRTLVLINHNRFSKLTEFFGRRNPAAVAKASPESEGNGSAGDDDDGVSLGTMKLPSNTDIPRFETLLFQVDKIPGGARLGFITIGDGQTEVLVYIDCLVFPASGNSGPIFRAVRNGPLKDQPPPGEPRIMRSLLQALKKSIEIARL